MESNGDVELDELGALLCHGGVNLMSQGRRICLLRKSLSLGDRCGDLGATQRLRPRLANTYQLVYEVFVAGLLL